MPKHVPLLQPRASPASCRRSPPEPQPARRRSFARPPACHSQAPSALLPLPAQQATPAAPATIARQGLLPHHSPACTSLLSPPQQKSCSWPGGGREGGGKRGEGQKQGGGLTELQACSWWSTMAWPSRAQTLHHPRCAAVGHPPHRARTAPPCPWHSSVPRNPPGKIQRGAKGRAGGRTMHLFDASGGGRGAAALA